MSDPIQVEAETFADISTEIAGIPVKIRIRAYVIGGKIRAIRSARVFDGMGKAFPTIMDGKANWHDDIEQLEQLKP